jgi:hypothetical protein
VAWRFRNTHAFGALGDSFLVRNTSHYYRKLPYTFMTARQLQSCYRFIVHAADGEYNAGCRLNARPPLLWLGGARSGSYCLPLPRLRCQSAVVMICGALLLQFLACVAVTRVLQCCRDVVATHIAVYEGCAEFDCGERRTPCTTRAWSAFNFLVDRTVPLLNGPSQCLRASNAALAGCARPRCDL